VVSDRKNTIRDQQQQVTKMNQEPKSEAEVVGELTDLCGDRFADYRNKWDRVNAFELETEFPLFLHVEPNYKCNFRCPMCTQGIPALKEKFGYKERLTTKDIASIVEQGQQAGCPSISFQGDNEPFLIKEIADWFKMARDAGFIDIMVNTNGSVMTEKLAGRIIESGLTRIRFSLDAATLATYERIRVGGDFKKVCRNIDTFLAMRARLGAKLPKVGVNFVKMASNAHEIRQFKELWASRADYVVVQDFMAPDVEGDYTAMDIDGRPVVPEFRCTQPWQRLYIRGNGDVTPCCAMFSSHLKLGNIHESKLIDLWQSEQAVALRRLHADGRYRENSICLRCSKNGNVLAVGERGQRTEPISVART
jgi:radical SAM protein with 4Fe4S-binding SPASM domain